jgi:hypothetical protein
LTRNDPYAVIDLDNKPDNPASQEQLLRHTKIYEAFESYTEVSVSGTGVHIVVRGDLPSGVHRDHVEIYSSERYMAFTGNVLRNYPIRDCQPTLNILYGEMRPPDVVELSDGTSSMGDDEVVSMAMRASNADKFNRLCVGDMTEYPSQSEADFALLSILAYYTQDNEQVRRLFRMTELGKRSKATKNDTYLNFALGKIRAKQPPPVDLSVLIANANAVTETPGFKSPDEDSDHLENPLSISHYKAGDSIILPPGMIGEIASYFYQTAIRPVPEVALAAAISLVAGICGRSYNVSGSGLNQYLILLAKTGSGKEGALMGIENLISAIRPTIPMVDQFIGPSAFASGQALIKVLNDKPCFVSVLGEFGLTLQQLSDHRANSSQLMLRKVLLDLYAKSGWNRMLWSSVYSDTDKNTKIIKAPNVTILGESTPETFFDGLDPSHIAEGLIPRFSIMEYAGDRKPRNRASNIPPSPGLVQKVAELITISLTTSNNNACASVQLDDHSMRLMDDFDTYADKVMNSSHTEVEVQLWNRAHLKALKIAALLAVGCNPHRPTITPDLARWAIAFVISDVSCVISRFTKGDVGQGDSKQFNDLKRAIELYLKNPPKAVKEQYNPLIKAKLVPYAYLIRKTASLSSYRNDKMGATPALKKTVQAFIDSGMLVVIPDQVMRDKHNFSGVTYGIGGNW